MCQFGGGDPVTQLILKMFKHNVEPYNVSIKNDTMYASERVFNSATFMCRHIVLTTIIHFSNLHLKNQKK